MNEKTKMKIIFEIFFIKSCQQLCFIIIFLMIGWLIKKLLQPAAGIFVHYMPIN